MTDFYCIEDLNYNCDDSQYCSGVEFAVSHWSLPYLDGSFTSINVSRNEPPYNEALFSPFSHMAHLYNDYLENAVITSTGDYVLNLRYLYGIYYVNGVGHYVHDDASITYTLLPCKLLWGVELDGSSLKCRYFVHDTTNHRWEYEYIPLMTELDPAPITYDELIGKPSVYYANTYSEYLYILSHQVKTNDIIVDKYSAADPIIYYYTASRERPYSGSGRCNSNAYYDAGYQHRLSNDNNRSYIHLPLGVDGESYPLGTVLTANDGSCIYYAIKDNVTKPIDGSNVCDDDTKKDYYYNSNRPTEDWIKITDLVKKINRHNIYIDNVLWDS